jgi:transposase
VFTCTVHVLRDARGIPLVSHLTPGDAADCTAFEEVIPLAEERPCYPLADNGYDSDAIRASPHEAGIRSCIPLRSNRLAKIRWNRRMCRERDRIKRMIGHLKINRANEMNCVTLPVLSVLWISSSSRWVGVTFMVRLMVCHSLGSILWDRR